LKQRRGNKKDGQKCLLTAKKRIEKGTWVSLFAKNDGPSASLGRRAAARPRANRGDGSSALKKKSLCDHGEARSCEMDGRKPALGPSPIKNGRCIKGRNRKNG